MQSSSSRTPWSCRASTSARTCSKASCLSSTSARTRSKASFDLGFGIRTTVEKMKLPVSSIPRRLSWCPMPQLRCMPHCFSPEAVSCACVKAFRIPSSCSARPLASPESPSVNVWLGSLASTHLFTSFETNSRALSLWNLWIGMWSDLNLL